MKRQVLCAGLVVVMGVAGSAQAQDPQAFPDFTFKRVKTPAARTGPKITVQVEPDFDPWARTTPIATAPSEPESPQDTPTTKPKGPLDWYWTHVSADLTHASSARLDSAVQALSKGPGGSQVPAPALQSMQGIAGTYGTDILKATIGTRVSPALVLALISIESSGRADAVSHAGASGLMQLMPATAARFGVTDIASPADNIRGGVAFLNWLIEEFGGDPVLVLAAYNAGENAVLKHAGVPPYAETRAYVPKVLAAWQVAQALCMTPPDLITDACVFNAQRIAKNG